MGTGGRKDDGLSFFCGEVFFVVSGGDGGGGMDDEWGYLARGGGVCKGCEKEEGDVEVGEREESLSRWTSRDDNGD